MEFWIGWFNNWGGEFKRRDAEDAANELRDVLDVGSVNIYMFHGGTNFGFLNGCSYHNGIDPQTTTYDYDAPLTEWGDFGPKYHAFKNVIKDFTDIPNVQFTTDIKFKAYGTAKLKNKVSLTNTLDSLAKPVYNDFTLNMEALNQSYGYILYRANVGNKRSLEKAKLVDCDDRAQVFVNDRHVVTQFGNELSENFKIDFNKDEDNIMDVLVENTGRINYGASLLSPKMRKGIKGGVMLDLHFHTGWDHYNLDLENIENVDFSKDFIENAPSFYEYEFEVSEKGDTFLHVDKFGKGCAFINGFNLGKFWNVGPTNYLYIPTPLLKLGLNKIVIFETEGTYSKEITLSDKPLY